MAESTGKVTGDGKRGEQVLQARGTKVAKQKCNKDIFIFAYKLLKFNGQFLQHACIYMYLRMHDCACIWSLPGQKCTCTGLATLTSA